MKPWRVFSLVSLLALLFALPLAAQPQGGLYIPYCGNGILDAGEMCDDGNTNAFDGCNDCKLMIKAPAQNQYYCGNEEVEPGEECDPPSPYPILYAVTRGYFCDESCRYVSTTCGNGKLGLGEWCDDGNKQNGDGCSEDCNFESAPIYGTPASICGNDILENGEECDHGNANGRRGSSCRSDCKLVRTIQTPLRQ